MVTNTVYSDKPNNFLKGNLKITAKSMDLQQCFALLAPITVALEYRLQI